MSDDLKALDRAATPAPWMVGYNGMIVDLVMGVVTDEQQTNRIAECTVVRDTALIVALRNAYASGDLVPREQVDALVEVMESIRNAPVVMFGGLPFISFGALAQETRRTALAALDSEEAGR